MLSGDEYLLGSLRLSANQSRAEVLSDFASLANEVPSLACHFSTSYSESAQAKQTTQRLRSLTWSIGWPWFNTHPHEMQLKTATAPNGPYLEFSREVILQRYRSADIPRGSFVRESQEHPWVQIDEALELPWVAKRREITAEALQLKETIQDCLVHSEDYSCPHCRTWVQPFFDYEQAQSNGVAYQTEQGATLYRSKASTKEIVRCRNCGKKLDQPGSAIAAVYATRLHEANQRLALLSHEEDTWHNPEQSIRLYNEKMITVGVLVALGVLAVVFVIFRLQAG